MADNCARFGEEIADRQRVGSAIGESIRPLHQWQGHGKDTAENQRRNNKEVNSQNLPSAKLRGSIVEVRTTIDSRYLRTFPLN